MRRDDIDLTAKQMEEDLALARARTPGEWVGNEYAIKGPGPDYIAVVCDGEYIENPEENVTFICAAAARFESYILALQEARGEIERLNEQLIMRPYPAEMLEQLKSSAAREAILVEALSFYADQKHIVSCYTDDDKWRNQPDGDYDIFDINYIESGARARTALKEVEK